MKIVDSRINNSLLFYFTILTLEDSNLTLGRSINIK